MPGEKGQDKVGGMILPHLGLIRTVSLMLQQMFGQRFMIRVFTYTLCILLFASPAWAATYDVCAAGCNYANVAAVNAFDFADNDVIQFERGETFNDATLTLAGITGADKTITIEAGGAGALPILDGNSNQPIAIDEDLTTLTIKNLNIDGMDRAGSTWNLLLGDDITNVVIDGIECDGQAGAAGELDSNPRGCIGLGDHTGDITIKNSTLENAVLVGGVGAQGLGNLIMLYWTLGSSKTAGTVAIYDNTLSGANCDLMQITGIENEVDIQIYDNTMSSWSENAIDLKEVEGALIYGNSFDRNQYDVGCDSAGSDTQAAVQFINPGKWASTSDGNKVYENYFTDDQFMGVYPAGGGTYEVHHNSFVDVRSAIRLISGTDHLIHNNIFKQTAAHTSDKNQRLSAIDIDHVGGITMDGVVITNNTIYSSSTSNLYGIYYEGDGELTNFTIENNIIELDRNAATVYPLYAINGDGGWPTVNNNTTYNPSHTNRVYWDDTYDSTEQAAFRALEGADTQALFTDPGIDANLKLDAALSDGKATAFSAEYIDPDSTFTPSISVITMSDNERGAYGYQDSPPLQGDTGLYNVIGGTKKRTVGGTKTTILSGE